MGLEATNFIEIAKQKFGSNPPKVILEIGSRDLDQSIQFSQAFPEARVIAFEPNPEMIPLCRDKSKSYPNIEFCDYAISDTDSIVDFYITDSRLNAGASSMLEPIDRGMKLHEGPHPLLYWKKVTGIQSRRLDNILSEIGVTSVDIIWLDVQGVELRALKGMGNFLNDVKMIHTEAAPTAYYKGHDLKNELEQFLTEQGFDYKFIPAGGHLYGEGDLICVRKNF
jgi:FkbM family methyltransferase